MSRTANILSRFPAHFEAARPGKLLGEVVGTMARDLEVQATQIGAVRRAHRVREAETNGDLMRIAALHDIRPRDIDVLTKRLTRIAAAAKTLAAAPDDADAQAALLTLWSLEIAGDPLDPFTGVAGLAPVEALQDAVTHTTRFAARRAAVSRRIIRICDTHARGNGTVRALLYGAANALDLDILSITHSADRYTHAARALDMLPLIPDPTTDLAPPTPREDVFGLQENPLRRAKQDPVDRRHSECFEILRKGFEPARMEISFTAHGDRGVGPMIVNRDQGRGVGYAGTVPAGQTLIFSENGRVTIGGSDVTALAYGFEGAVFADADNAHPGDRGVAGLAPDDPDSFDGARFVVATPPGALNTQARFPHAGLSIPMPDVAVGKTRMAFFAQQAHFGRAADPPDRPDDSIVTPRPAAGFFAGPGAPLGSVFAPDDGALAAPAGLLSFAWSEREAYKVRVLIPPRFRSYGDDPEGRDVTDRVTQALDRFRPAGVAVETVFIDDRWVLGEGVLNDADDGADDALIAMSGGMVLWPSPPDDTGPDGPALDT